MVCCPVVVVSVVVVVVVVVDHHYEINRYRLRNMYGVYIWGMHTEGPLTGALGIDLNVMA